MDSSGSITYGRPATSDPNPRTSVVPPSSTTQVPPTSTTDPVTSTTTNPTTDPSSTTTTNDYTNPPGSTTSTTPPPSSTTTTPPPVISTTKEIATSTPVPIVTVTTSGTVVRTYTSTSYSSYITHIATAVPNPAVGSGSTNVGAIAGGVVGGVSAIVLIGFIVIILTKRRRNKHKETTYASEAGDPSGGAGMGSLNPHPFGNDYNTYGTPTVISDNNSLPGSRPLSMSTAPSQGIKPRPFVQAYNPTYEDQHQYAGYDGAHSPPQDQYYNDYQPYNNTYNNNAYSHDAYYAHQQEPMIPVSTSSTGISTNNGRNVPDENDYDLSRKVSRHVPDEIPSVPHTR